MQETRVRSLGLEDPLEKKMATHPSILAWAIPWTEEPSGLQSWDHKEVDTTWQLNNNIIMFCTASSQLLCIPLTRVHMPAATSIRHLVSLFECILDILGVLLRSGLPQNILQCSRCGCEQNKSQFLVLETTFLLTQPKWNHRGGNNTSSAHPDQVQ